MNRPRERPAPFTAGLGQNGDVAVVPKIPGHSIRVFPTESGRRWEVLCECGFGGRHPNNPDTPLRTYATDAVALAVAIRHLRKLMRAPEEAARRNGLSTSPLHRAG
jgi:hypothetical protein